MFLVSIHKSRFIVKDELIRSKSHIDESIYKGCSHILTCSDDGVYTWVSYRNVQSFASTAYLRHALGTYDSSLEAND